LERILTKNGPLSKGGHFFLLLFGRVIFGRSIACGIDHRRGSGTGRSSRSDWLHEIKYDGYRLRVERNGDRVRLIRRGGYDWANR
jgi:hypothetical protein